MALNEKTLLLICNDDAAAGKISASLEGKVKKVILAKSSSEALSKASNQVFDGFIVRQTPALLTDPKGPFVWCSNQDNYKKAPWIILGKDIEDEQILIKHNNVKFVEDPQNLEALSSMLNGAFFDTGGGQAPIIDVNFINPIVKAIAEVIKTMASIELKRETPYIKKSPNESTLKGDISGIIAMNSNRFVGSMAISYEQSLILQVFKNMLGTEVNEINDDVKDCVSELTNIIFGNAKRDLNAAGHTITPALPSVITGKGHEIRHSVQGICLVIPFSCASGRVAIETVINTQLVGGK